MSEKQEKRKRQRARRLAIVPAEDAEDADERPLTESERADAMRAEFPEYFNRDGTLKIPQWLKALGAG